MFLSVLNVGLLVAVVAIFGRGAEAGEWDYSDPENWVNDYPDCGGKQQSPVNINRFAVTTGSFNPIQFHNYDVLPSRQYVVNDGHTIKVEITWSRAYPYIEWGVFWLFWFKTVKYHFAQYHFHWGSVDGQGSEHTVDTVRYPMEVHLVHYNDKYADIGEAVTKSDGLAVLGIFFQISSTDNPALAPLVAAIQEVADYSAEPNYVEKNTLFALASLLPSDTKRFYRYDGSLTTPGCSESVLWTVFEEPIQISVAQMEEFRKLVKTAGTPLSDNYRPVQDLNSRKVKKSWS